MGGHVFRAGVDTMPSFRYRAKDRSGREFDGVTVADDQRTAVAQLQSMGHYILSVQEIREGSTFGRSPLGLFAQFLVNPVFTGVSIRDLAVFYRAFATMIKSGMTLVQAMSSLSRQSANRRLRSIAAEVLPIVRDGGLLSDAFARYPWIFPELHINMLRAGETGGRLDAMLESLAQYTEREHSVRQRLRLATLYPKILILAVIFIPSLPILVLQGFWPYFNATLRHILPLVGILLVLWVAYRILYQVKGVRYALDLLKLCIPKIGKMVRMLALSKFYRVLASMYAAGVPLSQGVLYAADSCNNWFLARRLRRAVPVVEEGGPVADALRRTGVLPPMALDMLSTGEQTGNIDGMLEKAAEYTENEAEVAMTQSTVVAGVLLLLAVGAYIGWFVIQFYVRQYSGIIGQQW